MDPRKVKSIADARAIVEKRGLNYVKVGVFDIDGIMRGKYMSKEKFFSSLEKGFGFCDVVVGWDSHDKLYDNVTITGWHTAYPDAAVRILPESCREIAWEDGMLFFLGEFAGKYEAVCPRAVLRRTLERADAMG
ncbi:MAG: glutamine synthetase, partial [Proteobacteria bacterium]|nr:glutamine synthetase [Pseudomonadota bacterium]